MTKLSRRRQDAILLHCVVLARIVGRQRSYLACGHRLRLGTTIAKDLAGLRESLRLDDPVLDDLIAAKKSSGEPWGPWQSETYERIEP